MLMLSGTMFYMDASPKMTKKKKNQSKTWVFHAVLLGVMSIHQL